MSGAAPTDTAAQAACRGCRHFYITHDAAFPYGCRHFGFKSRRTPVLEVIEPGLPVCLGLTPRARPEKRG